MVVGELNVRVGNEEVENVQVNMESLIRMRVEEGCWKCYGVSGMKQSFLSSLGVRKKEGRLAGVLVIKCEGGGVRDDFLVQSKLKLYSEWNATRVTGVKEAVKVSELDKREKEPVCVEILRGECEQVKKPEVENVEVE